MRHVRMRRCRRGRGHRRAGGSVDVGVPLRGCPWAAGLGAVRAGPVGGAGVAEPRGLNLNQIAWTVNRGQGVPPDLDEVLAEVRAAVERLAEWEG